MARITAFPRPKREKKNPLSAKFKLGRRAFTRQEFEKELQRRRREAKKDEEE